MRHVHPRGGVGCAQAQNCPRGHTGEALLCLKNGQGAQKADRVYVFIPNHDSRVGKPVGFVHGLVMPDTGSVRDVRAF